MEKSDVIKIKSLLRNCTRTKEVFDKDTHESLGQKEIAYPICVELDNSLAISEEVDNVIWNDTEGIIATLRVNSGNVRGAEWAMGTNKIQNPCEAIIADYGEIQQFRIVLDENGMRKLLEAMQSNGNFKYCKDKSEVTLDGNVVARVIKNLCHDIQPENMIPKKTSDYYVK